MEQNSSAFDSFESTLSETAISYLKESAKWSKFLGIIGFIGVGLMVVMAFIMATVLSSMNNSAIGGGMPIPPAMFSLMYLFIAALYFMPVYYLFNYGNKITKAINSKDQNLLTEGLGNLKSHHKFLGICAIIVFSIYALILVIALFAGLASAF